jgi:predicted metal-dependent hydrolase
MQKIIYFNSFYNFKYNKIFIKNHQRRWGSCSSKRNLNFNYKIIFLPERLQNYLIVHELCHLKEMNHSKGFWALVAKTIPDYEKLNKQLKKIAVY